MADIAPEPADDSTAGLRDWRIRALNVLLTVGAVLALPSVALAVMQAIEAPEQWLAAFAFGVMYLLLVGLAISRKLDYRMRAWGLLLIGYAAEALSFIRGGLAGDGRVYVMALPVLALVLVGIRSGIVMTVLGLLTYAGVAALAHLGYLENWLVLPENPLNLNSWIDSGTDIVMLLVPIVVLLWQLTRFQTKTMLAERKAALDLGQTSDLLQQRAEELERANILLAKRTQALTAATDVLQQIASLTDMQDLADRFVHLISSRFGVYHVGLFLLDPQQENAVLRAASSELGQARIRHGYQVRVGSVDPVGQVARSRQPYLGTESPVSLPDMPQTRWRVALALGIGGRVIGALDLHFDSEEPPSEEEISALQTLSDQLTLGLENAQLLARTQASLEELSRINRLMTGESWQQVVGTLPEVNRYEVGPETMPRETLDALFDQARRMGQPVSTVQSHAEDDGRHALAVPIKLRGVPIGVIGFQRPTGAGEWLPEEITLAEGAAERVAVALESARLFGETQRLAAQERMVSEITARMRETLDVDSILQTAASDLRSALGLAEVEVQVGTASGPHRPGRGSSSK